MDCAFHSGSTQAWGSSKWLSFPFFGLLGSSHPPLYRSGHKKSINWEYSGNDSRNKKFTFFRASLKALWHPLLPFSGRGWQSRRGMLCLGHPIQIWWCSTKSALIWSSANVWYSQNNTRSRMKSQTSLRLAQLNVLALNFWLTCNLTQTWKDDSQGRLKGRLLRPTSFSFFNSTACYAKYHCGFYDRLFRLAL